ncbi:MAG: polyamine ABC transporter substrate-binding protein [Gammaproteobacteria bacterium]|nr:polyamine ABC transporter substrate-binding protein [Gammaproteobacteria bacterium]
MLPRLAISFLSVVFVMTGGFARPADAEESVLNIYNWADYIGSDTISDFEDEYGIEVNYDVYEASEMVDAKLMAGSSGYDLVLHGAAFSARLITAGIYRPLDKKRLPNWRHLDPDLLQRFDHFDPGLRFGVPYMWGTTGFTYNVDMILERMPDAPVASGDLLFKPEIVSKFADCGVSLLDAPVTVIPVVLAYLGYEADSVEPEHLKEVELLLKSIRPYIKYFSSAKLLVDLPSREVCIAQSWSGDYAVASRRARDAGLEVNLAYTMPIEGSTIWFDALFIPADAPHPDNAHLFLDYLLRPEVIARVSDFIGYANPNRDATALVDPAITSDPAIYPDAEVQSRLQSTRVYQPKIERLRSRVWSRVKTGL